MIKIPRVTLHQFSKEAFNYPQLAAVGEEEGGEMIGYRSTSQEVHAAIMDVGGSLRMQGMERRL